MKKKLHNINPADPTAVTFCMLETHANSVLDTNTVYNATAGFYF